MTPGNPRRLKLELPWNVRLALIEHALRDSPNECCGFLVGDVAGDVGRIRKHLPLINSMNSSNEFLTEPRSVFEANRAMRLESTLHLAIYHSHPISLPIPSRKDIERNTYGSEIAWLILGAPLEDPKIGIWRLSDTDYEPVVWRVIPAQEGIVKV